ncbi:MAG: aspartyl protease family protein [Planctomycetes bacterium]|nr:aspartyl protease family protein [Planctomycetota bacterium]
MHSAVTTSAMLIVGICTGCASPPTAAADAVAPARISPLPPGFTVRDHLDYSNLQDALRNGGFDHAKNLPEEPPADVAALVEALQLVVDGGTDRALEHFAALEHATEAGLRGLAKQVVASLLYDRRDYAALARRLGESTDPGAKLVRLLATLPPQTVAPAPSIADELRKSSRGHPQARVAANGHVGYWFLDTGASQCVVSSSHARSLGVELLDAEPIDIRTATALVRPARVGRLSELRLGEVVAHDVAVLVFDDADLTFEVDDGTLRIDGIVGWPVLRELRTEIDYARGRYHAQLSQPQPSGPRNFSWLGYPIVKLAADNGQPLLFGLDTGSRNTSISDNAFRKIDFASVRPSTAEVGGVGGAVATEVRVVDRLGLALAGWHVELRDVRTEHASGSSDVVFFAADGVLGSDIAQSCTLVLDYRNGTLELQPAGDPGPSTVCIDAAGATARDGSATHRSKRPGQASR